ncbi:MAG: Fe-S cluster assembly protein SufD [Nanoarchaeota archaeon]
MTQNLKFTEKEIVKDIQEYEEPHWMKEKRLNALDLFNSLPHPEFRYGITININSSDLNFSEINLPAKKLIDLPKNDEIIIINLSEALFTHEDLVKKHFLSCFPTLGKFEALHTLLWNKGVFIYVPKNTVIKKPIKLIDSNDNFEFQHNLIIVDENSSLSIFEEETSNSNEKSYKTKITEIIVNDNSALNYGSFQNLSQNTINFSTKRALVHQNSNINWINFDLGSKLNKSEVITKLEKEGSNTNVFNLFFTNNNQQFDLSSSIFHNSKHTKSDMAVRGALDNKSKVIINGLVKIAERATNSNGYQKQDALLLSQDAEIDPIPNLEIDNNEVKCSHGTTVSRLDKEKLFYLKSRGIPEDKASKLMIKGFFDPIIRKIKLKEVRKDLRKAISLKM